MAIGHRKPEIERTARFVAADASLSELPLYAGDTTGGRLDEQRFDATGSWHLFQVSIHVQPDATRYDPIAQALEEIKKTFDLTQEALGEACGVSRAMISRWRDGTIPRENNRQRLFQLREAALNWQREGYPAPGTSLHLPLVQGKSLFDLLRAKPLDMEAILFAGNRLKLMALEESAEVIPNPFE